MFYYILIALSSSRLRDCSPYSEAISSLYCNQALRASLVMLKTVISLAFVTSQYLCYAPIPVQRYEAQVHDGRSTQQHIHSRVYFTPPEAEDPVAHQLVRERERHYH